MPVDAETEVHPWRVDAGLGGITVVIQIHGAEIEQEGFNLHARREIQRQVFVQFQGPGITVEVGGKDVTGGDPFPVPLGLQPQFAPDKLSFPQQLTFENPIRFSPHPASLKFVIEYLKPPVSKILLQVTYISISKDYLKRIVSYLKR